MPSNKTPENQIRQLHAFAAQGMTSRQIAVEMDKLFPGNWNGKNAFQKVLRLLKGSEAPPKPVVMADKTLDEMTREERFRYIEAKLQSTPRFKMVFHTFDDMSKDVFVDEYLNILRTTETLTEIEEQSLFASILELVLAIQALNRKEREEKLRDESLAGKIKPDDPLYRTHVNDKYHSEYDQHMKLYQKGTEQLKMARKDRLKEVRSNKQTLVDLAEEFTSKSVQHEAAVEIERLSRMKDEELKRLIDEGHLFGIFGEF